jgi:hypothetical protein
MAPAQHAEERVIQVEIPGEGGVPRNIAPVVFIVGVASVLDGMVYRRSKLHAAATINTSLAMLLVVETGHGIVDPHH